MPQTLNLEGIADATAPKPGQKTSGLNLDGIPDAAKVDDDASESSLTRTILDTLGGARSGLATTVFRGGDAIRRLTGMERVIDTPEVKAAMTAPKSTAGSVGRTAEQVGEFLIPATKISKAIKGSRLAMQLLKAGLTPAKAMLATGAIEGAAQGATAYGQTKLQGGYHAGLSAAISAIAPVAAKSVEIGAPAIRAAAQTKLARLLATGVEDKGHGALVDYALKTGVKAGDAVRGSVDKAVAIVRDAAGELLDLPVNASWGKWQTMLASRSESAKKLLGTALDGDFGRARVSTEPLIAAFDEMASTASQHLAEVQGGVKNVTFDAPLNKELIALRDTLAKYGDEANGFGKMITVRNLVDLKRVWDKTVYTLAQAGKVNADPTTLISSAMKEAAFTGANAIRRVLDDEAPTIAKLDEVVSHAIRLEDLVRKVAAAHPGMGETAKALAQGAATVIGGAAGATMGHWWAGASLGLGATRLLTKAIESPLWHTVSPKVKNAVAQAIQRGDADAVRRLVAPVVAGAATQ